MLLWVLFSRSIRGAETGHFGLISENFDFFFLNFSENFTVLGGLPRHISIHYLNIFVLISEGSEISGKWEEIRRWADQNNA